MNTLNHLNYEVTMIPITQPAALTVEAALAERDRVIATIQKAVAAQLRRYHASEVARIATRTLADTVDKAILDYTTSAIIRGIPV